MRYLQPQSGMAIDWSNPITRGLAAVFDMTGSYPVDLITGYKGVAPYTRSMSTSGIGLQRVSAATADGTATLLKANPSAALVISAPPASSVIKPFFSQRPAGGGGQYTFGANMDAAFTASAGRLTMSTNGAVALTAPGVITGKTSVYGYSLTSSSAGQLYVDGAAVTTTVSGTTYPSMTSPNFNLLMHAGAGAFNDACTPLICLWNRSLSAAEHAALAANPWQLFRIQRLVLPSASAGGPQSLTVTPTGGISFSGAAAVVRSTARVASGGLTLGGTAPTARSASRATSGGLVLGGSASSSRGAVRAPQGGLLLAGTAPVQQNSSNQSRTVTPTGGIVFSGAAQVVRSMRYQPVGGVTFGGSAGYTNSGIVPQLFAIMRRRARPRVLPTSR
jgi:hypothetical protein